jgi:pSer/pThr/pTyr-binding forkhead associated (FHA) protein
MSNFTEPSWAVTPSSEKEWKLLEIKGGVEVACHRLDKKCVILRRAASDVNGIALAHESCSRLHARIAFDENGTPWLRDLNSSHGTCVNKRKLPPPPEAAAACDDGTDKHGGGGGMLKRAGSCSRGVVLYPGDVLQFGASTRIYCLEGPPEYERGGAIPLRTQVQNASAGITVNDTTNNNDIVVTANDEKKKKKKNDTSTNAEFSWGMILTDDNEDMDESSIALDKKKQQQQQQHETLDPGKIPEKHLKLFERLTAKQYKLQNVQLESERIRNKGTSDLLTQGQEAQLRKNEERIQQWQDEIHALEQELHAKVFPNNTATIQQSSHVTTTGNEEDDDDDCEFYDRTKNTQDELFQDGETQESLIVKWKDLVSEWNQCSKSLLDAQQNMNRLEQRLKLADPTDEDAFFLQNDVDLQKDSLSKAQGRLEEIIKNIHETERLLKVVNSNIEFDRETGYIGEPSNEKKDMRETTMNGVKDDATMMPPPSASSPRILSPAASAMPPPFQMPPPMKMPPPQLPTKHEAFVLSSAAKKPRILGPSAMPPSSFGGSATGLAVDEMEMPPPQGHSPPLPRRRAPPIGTLSVVLAGASSVSKRKHENPASPKQQQQQPAKQKLDDSGFDSKKDVWKAPNDQDGSGITKLNAKFAGRY